MKPSSLTKIMAFSLFAALSAAWAPQAAVAEALTPGFTYQGRVSKNGGPLTGPCDLRFTLYDAPAGGAQVGNGITTTSVNVANGLFSILINTKNEFGTQAFSGQRRWLAVAVRHPAGSGSYVTLAPRQELSATPYALGLIGGASIRNDVAGGAGLVVESLSGDGLAAAAHARAKAGLFGQHKNGGSGVLGQTTSDATSATAGVAGVNGGGGAGVAGQSQSGFGVQGLNPGPNGPNAGGVMGSSSNNFGVIGASSNKAGVYGTSFNDPGVYGLSAKSYGVYGSTANANGKSAVYGDHMTTGSGVMGHGTVNGIGVQGVAGSGSGFYSYAYTKGIGVWGDSASGPGVYATGANYPGLYVESTGAPAIKIGYAGGFNLLDGGRFWFSSQGYLTCGRVRVQPTDLAEIIPVAQDKPQPGDVVEIDPDNANNFRLAATANSTRVAGVISTEPGLTLGSTMNEEADKGKPQLALAGRAPVKVCDEGGPIRPGDLLAASSTPGHAMRAPASPAPGTIIGKALEPFASGSGVINMLVMLR